MKREITIALLILLTALPAMTQNLTDNSGKRQGPWVKRYPNGKIMYEGTFRDDRPAGLFSRYNEEGVLVSELRYSAEGDKADALFYYPDGVVAAKGSYEGQRKEGRWSFWSETIPHYLISEESYHQDVRHGLSVKYYPDSTVAEQVTWDSGLCSGEWLRYHQGGTVSLRAEYIEGRLEGPFSYYHPNGNLHYEGQYKHDLREGDWMVFNEDGSLKQIIEYRKGVPASPKIAEEETRFLDNLEKNKGKIVVTDITGTVIQ